MGLPLPYSAKGPSLDWTNWELPQGQKKHGKCVPDAMRDLVGHKKTEKYTKLLVTLLLPSSMV